MLKIDIPEEEYYDESTKRFVTARAETIIFEHSLFSISEWESKWKKPFLSDAPKTREELNDYMRCMTLNKDSVSESVYSRLSSENVQKIVSYMNDSMTATTVKHDGGRSRRIVTAEVIYSWMVALQIPFECQYWHLNRLMMFIDVCNEEQKPPKKMSKAQTMRQNSALNKARLAGKRH